MIAGEDAAGKDVVLIGRDAIAATAFALQVEEATVKKIIAQDFGVEEDRLVFVEQPGKFHLDMGLLFLGKGLCVSGKVHPRNKHLMQRFCE